MFKTISRWHILGWRKAYFNIRIPRWIYKWGGGINGKWHNIQWYDVPEWDSPLYLWCPCKIIFEGYKGTHGTMLMRSALLVGCIWETQWHSLNWMHQTYPEHHVGDSPLVRLPHGLVSHFPLDSIHLVYISIVGRMLRSWKSGSYNMRLNTQGIKRISSALENLTHNWPSKFSRSPRSLSYLDRWKANESQQIFTLDPL